MEGRVGCACLLVPVGGARALVQHLRPRMPRTPAPRVPFHHQLLPTLSSCLCVCCRQEAAAAAAAPLWRSRSPSTTPRHQTYSSPPHCTHQTYPVQIMASSDSVQGRSCVACPGEVAHPSATQYDDPSIPNWRRGEAVAHALGGLVPRAAEEPGGWCVGGRAWVTGAVN